MRESSVERKLYALARRLGGRAIKLQRTGRRGDVDRILVLPRGVTIWVEVKRPRQVPRPEQRRVHAKLRKLGHKVLVVDGTNWPQVFTFLQRMV